VPRSAMPSLEGTMRPSLAVALMIKATLGDGIRSGDVLRLSPMAFAGWLGLLLTALNLMPIGQLDGGHMARSMFGTRVGTIVSSIAMGLLAIAALTVAPQLLVWAMVVFFMGTRGTPPLNDVTPITPQRLLIGAFAFLIFIAILMPAGF
jgi:membrane-associated protease RseP (regulator of RpoE activity)